MLARGLIERRGLLRFFEQIEPRLYRFPAIDPKSFRRAVEAVCREEDAGQEGTASSRATCAEPGPGQASRETASSDQAVSYLFPSESSNPRDLSPGACRAVTGCRPSRS